MLDFIRRNVQSVFAKVFLSILAITFVLCFGLSDIIRKWFGQDYVVKVGSVKIAPNVFLSEKNKLMHLLSKNKNDANSEKNINNVVIQNLVMKTVADLAVVDFGFYITDDIINRYIVNSEEFKNKNGVFDKVMIRKMLSVLNMSEQLFFENVKKGVGELLVKAAGNDVCGKEVVDLFHEAFGESRELLVAKINIKDIVIPAKSINKKDLFDFYQKHKDEFFIPELRTFKVFYFSENDVKKSINVTDEEIENAFLDKNDPSLKLEDVKESIIDSILANIVPERINAMIRHIEDDLTVGRADSEIVAEFGLKVVEAKDIDSNNQLVSGSGTKLNLRYQDKVLKAAFSSYAEEQPSFEESIDNKDKIHWIVKIESIKPKRNGLFEECLVDVNKAYIESKKRNIAFETSEKLINSVKKGEKLSNACAKMSLKCQKIEKFTREGIDNKEKKWAHAYNFINEVINEIFNADQGYINKFIDDQNIYVYQLNKIYHADDLTMENRISLCNEISKALSSDIYACLLNYLKIKHDIKVNYHLLKQISDDGTLIDYTSEF